MNLSDRLKASLEAFVLRLVGRYDYAVSYGYTVVSQNSDGTVDLKPDRPELVPPLSGVQILYSHPGEKVTVPAGVRCKVMFADRDPSKPFVLGWEASTANVLTLMNGSQPVARVGDTVAILFPPVLPIAGTVTGVGPFVGTLTIVTQGVGVIQTGQTKILG
jgi:hypothetical protein